MTSVLLIAFVVVLAALVAMVRMPPSRWRGLLGRHGRPCPVDVRSRGTGRGGR